MEKSIGVDVDLTIVDTLTEWVEWWEEKTGKEPLVKHTESVRSVRERALSR